MGSFLGACGATGPLHWVVERPGSAEVDRLAFDQPFLLVGRDPAADLCLRHPDVSDRHAYLQMVGGRLFCLDLGSRTGLYLDGLCRRTGWVDPQAVIRIGPYRLRLDGGDGDTREKDPVETSLSLELSHRSIRSSPCPVAGEMVLIGSAADCQARLLDSNVSSYHCGLLPTAQGTWVVDLLGRGGLSINGAAARLGRVYEGDVLRVGDSTVRLRPRGEEEARREPASGPFALGTPAAPVPARMPPVDLGSVLAGLPPEKAELAQTLLVPLVNQFGLMQQHLLDRLQQAERERFQALAALQQEQFGAIRDELDQLRELRQELDELRGELQAQGRSPTARGRSAGAAVSRPRLGSAAPAIVPPAGAPALEPPDVLRLSVGEAS